MSVTNAEDAGASAITQTACASAPRWPGISSWVRSLAYTPVIAHPTTTTTQPNSLHHPNYLSRQLTEERDLGRLGLAAPVAFGVGAYAYLANSQEASWLLLAAIAVTTIVFCLLVRGGAIRPLFAAACLWMAFGACAAKFEAWRVSAPIIPENLGAVKIVGWLERVERRPKRGTRLTLRLTSVEGLDQEKNSIPRAHNRAPGNAAGLGSGQCNRTCCPSEPAIATC